MAQWYVKDLSKLTGVSVQTLHHYDRIGLLKPSLRLSNGYRLYSEKDLVTLQQIIALKFFGFELGQIKTILMGTTDIRQSFSVQAHLLEEKAKSLLDASQTLKSITLDINDSQSVPWETIIKLIEVYKMTKNLENAWVAKVLDKEEIKEYAQFEQELKNRYSEEEKNKFAEEWGYLITQIENNLYEDPASNIGIQIGKECMNLINNLYGKEHAGLRHSIWHNGYKKGGMGTKYNLSPQVVAWLDKAISSYYKQRIYQILDQVGIISFEILFTQWNEVLEDMHGDNRELNNAVYEAALQDERISQKAKDWLKEIFNR